MQLPDTFNNERRFVFNNWSDEDFTGQWDGVQTVIKKGEIKEFPMYLAYHFTKHFVDREMAKDKSIDPKTIGIDTIRAPFEQKTISELTGDTESPALSSLKEQIRKEVEQEVVKKETGKKKVVKKEEDTTEFADLNKE